MNKRSCSVGRLGRRIAAAVLAAGCALLMSPTWAGSPVGVSCRARDVYDIGAATAQVNAYFSQLPPKMQAAFHAGGWRLIMREFMTVETILPVGSNEYIQGLTDYAARTVQIDESSPHVIFHEMGHWMDNSLGTPSLGPAFLAAYAAEGGHSTKYGAESSLEFYAEVFDGIIRGDAGLQARCPTAWALVSADYAKFL